MKAPDFILPQRRYKFGDRDGIAWLKKDVDQMMVGGGWFGSLMRSNGEECGFVELNDKMNEVTEQVEGAFTRFDAARHKFKTEMRNDATAIAAAADRMVSQFQKVQASIAGVAELLASQQMRTAIENAERLAAALASIEKLSASKVTFAVITPGKDA